MCVCVCVCVCVRVCARDHLVEIELSPEGQTAEKYLLNEPRMEGVGENVEREQFEVVDCEIVKLRKTPLKFCNAKCDKNQSKCTRGHEDVVEHKKMVRYYKYPSLTEWVWGSNDLSWLGT